MSALGPGSQAVPRPLPGHRCHPGEFHFLTGEDLGSGKLCLPQRPASRPGLLYYSRALGVSLVPGGTCVFSDFPPWEAE